VQALTGSQIEERIAAVSKRMQAATDGEPLIAVAAVFAGMLRGSLELSRMVTRIALDGGLHGVWDELEVAPGQGAEN
jgi:hypothetical protein